MSTHIRQRMSGDRRRGSLDTLVRTRIGGSSRALESSLQDSVFRHISVVGPQTPVGFEDSSWTYSTSLYGNTAWMVFFDHGATPTYTNGISPYYHWVRKMAPMRFRIDSLLDLFSGSGHTTIRTVFENQFDVGHSTLTPSATTHLRNFQTTAGSFPLRGITNKAYNVNDWASVLQVTHYRILVDGSDATGVVQLTVPLSLMVDTNTGVPRDFSGLPTAFLPFVAESGQTIEIDFWVHIDTAGGPFDIAMNWPLCEINAVAGFARAELRGTALPVRGTFRLSFPGGGPQDSIDLVPQSGWTYSSTATSHTLTNAEWTLTLDWSREYARVLVNRASENNMPSGAGSGMNYLPAGSGDYDGVEFSSGYIATPGKWNPDVATVFTLRQRQMLSGHSAAYATEFGASWPTALFSEYPSAVIVEKV